MCCVWIRIMNVYIIYLWYTWLCECSCVCVCHICMFRYVSIYVYMLYIWAMLRSELFIVSLCIWIYRRESICMLCRSYEGHLTGRNEYSCCKFSLRRYSTLVYRLVIERLLYRSFEASGRFLAEMLLRFSPSLSLSIFFYILRTYRKGSFLLFFFFWSHFIKIKIRFGFFHFVLFLLVFSR